MPEPTITTPPSAPPAPAPATDPTNIPPAPSATPPAENPPQTPAAPSTPARPDGVSDAEWNALGDPGKAALVRIRQEAAASAAEAARLRQQIEDAGKTAEQKAADDLKAAQEAAATNAAKALRYEIAAEVGLPLALAPRLTGATREEMLTDAATLQALIPAGATPPRTPAPDPGQGARPQEPKSAADQAYEDIYGAPKA